MTTGIASGKQRDRRQRPRLRLAYPLRLHLPGESAWVETKTEDLSCQGFACVSERPFSLHQVLECELVIPAEELDRAMRNNLILRCQAEVVRVMTNEQAGTFVVACQLMDYMINWQIERDRIFEVSSR